MVFNFSSRLRQVCLALVALACLAGARELHAQDGADTRPFVGVYPMKMPENTVVADIFTEDALDLNIIVLKTEEGLRNSKKMRLFERGQGGLNSINIEQKRASCASDNPNSAKADGNVISTGGAECEKRFEGNFAQTGQLSNVEFIVEIAVKELSIGDVVYRNMPEMPGKMRRSVGAKLELAVKVIDSRSGQIKFQVNVPATYTESGIAQDKSENTVDKRAVWSGLANDAGRKAATAIVGAMSN